MNDQETTGQMPEEEPPTEPQPEPRQAKRLLRSRSDRMLGGVAGGLGKYFGVDPLIFRIGFGISVFFGGLGAIAYLALLAFVPSEQEDGTVGEAPFQRSRVAAIAIGVGVFVLLASWGIFDGDPFWFDGDGWFFGGPLFLIAVIAALFYLLRRDRDRATSATGILTTVAIALVSAAVLCCLALGAAWAGATGSGEVVAGLIIVIGVLLVIAAFRGGARWLIVPALALALPLATVAAADVSFDGGVGREDHEPATVAAIPDEGYELGMGQLDVDLRSLEWKKDTVVDLAVDLGIGEVRVAVPESVCVTGDFSASAGAVEVGGDEVGGFDVDHQPEAGTTATPRLVLDGEVDLGALRVINDDDVDLDDDRDHGPFRDDGPSRDDMREAMEAACAIDEPEPSAAGKEKGSR
jgi:phage shock protein PspC (stress-responsive transcriptional regulator)